MSAVVSTPIYAKNRAAAVESTPAALDVRDLTVRYNSAPALEDISFTVRPGDKVAIIGPNGAGKSTLMKAVMGLIQAQSGSITIAGDNRQRLGYLPQNEEVNWDFPVTVRDVVMMGRTRHVGWRRWPGRDQWRAVDAALERVHMADLRDQPIGELSGGQRRRVFIARALAQEADILLLDEPFSGVDASAQASLMDVLDELNRQGITLILSTHDLSLAFQRFQTVMALKRRLIAYGPADHVYTPDILAQLYGGRLAAVSDGQQVTLFVDNHACKDC